LGKPTRFGKTYRDLNRPDRTSDKIYASGAGGMGFKFWADQISHTLPTTRHRCNLDCVGLGLCGPWRKAAEMGTAHSWHPKGY